MIHGAWPLIIVLLLAVGLAWPTLRRVLAEGRQRDIIEAEERRDAVRREILDAQPDYR